MPVGYTGLPTLHPIGGLRLGTASAGIKKAGRRDVVIFEMAEGSSVAGVFTRNAFCAAPVVLAKRHLVATPSRYFFVNTGNANAGTGAQGMADAAACCEALAEATGVGPEEVLPFSTGVIGEPLPVSKILAAIPDALTALSEDGWQDAAHGILTTDTVPKGSSRKLPLNGGTVTVTGIAKGSGMIRPDMATMLAYVGTDAAIETGLLQQILQKAVDVSFNRITVDGDTSTNDSCMLVATGTSGVTVEAGSGDAASLAQAISEVCIELAQLIIRDGEGASKFITIAVNGGRDEAECLAAAYTVAHSPLVKTAMFASDPNWGRILAAVGRAGIAELDLQRVRIFLGDICIVRDGGRAPEYTEAQGQAAMASEEILVRIELARGDASATVWTCDLSYDYVKINAEYRT